MNTNTFSFGTFTWWLGVVEDNKNDPEKLGRVRVRIFGYHTDKKNDLPTEDLFWAVVMHPTTSAAISGIGHSPSGLMQGSNVVGFFMDGGDAQVPVIMGAIGGAPEKNVGLQGFADPEGKYPKYDQAESDINRIARNEKIGETIIQKKKDNLDEARIAFGGEWKEPATPYAAKYPNNLVYETSAGHVVEFDNTEGKERIHVYHKAGTFEEIHQDGKRVQKNIKDKYSITLGDEYVHVKGKCNLTVSGNCNIKIEGNCNMEVDGNMKQHIHGNSTLDVDGNYTVKVKGRHEDQASHRVIKANRVDFDKL